MGDQQNQDNNLDVTTAASGLLDSLQGRWIQMKDGGDLSEVRPVFTIEGDQVFALGGLDVLGFIKVSEEVSEEEVIRTIIFKQVGGSSEAEECSHGTIKEEEVNSSLTADVLIITWDDHERWRQVVSGDDPYVVQSDENEEQRRWTKNGQKGSELQLGLAAVGMKNARGAGVKPPE